MKRRLLKLIVFVLLGAILNVAVAWACSQYSQHSTTLGRAVFRAFWNRDQNFVGDAIRYQPFSERNLGFHVNGYPGDDPVRQMRVVISAGWPFQSVHCWAYLGNERWVESPWRIRLPDTSARMWFLLRRQHELPLVPLWPGFAINTIFYAAILWMLFAAPLALRRRRRIKRGLCPACAYPIGANDVCTECGKPVSSRRDAGM